MARRWWRLAAPLILGFAATLLAVGDEDRTWQSLATAMRPSAPDLPRVVRPVQPSTRLSAPLGSRVTGPVRVRDGDTIVVGGVPVRLGGLHCPENGEAIGRQATARMRDLVALGPVSCTLSGERTHDRAVGRCAVGGRDLAAVLIGEGFCARCPRHDTEGRYTATQSRASPWLHGLPGYCKPR